MIKQLLFAFVLLSFVTIACKKDKNKALTPVELITSATWKIDTIGFDLNGDNEMDSPLPFGLSACEKDNLITFNADSTGVYSEGESKCATSDPDNTPFTWSFKNENKVLSINGELNDLLKGDIDIVVLNESTLVVAKQITLGGAFPSTTKIIGHFKK